jgi:hypothetical protein
VDAQTQKKKKDLNSKGTLKMVTMHSFDKHHWQPMLSCAVVNRC